MLIQHIFTREKSIRRSVIVLIGMLLVAQAYSVRASNMAATYILNEDSHPHPVHPGGTARFSLEASRLIARMDVKCSLEGEDGKPVAAVTLRTQGLTGVQWPFPSRSIRVEQKTDFDIVARTEPGTDNPAWFEFVNDDPSRILWHQCYNN
jgi:hypothetical protein